VPRDIIVIGASAGGLTPLCTLIRGLPREFPAAIFIVVHVAEESVLPEVLRTCGSVAIEQAAHEAPIQNGRVYVAPPRTHLLLESDRMILSSGPRENRHRPSVDVLFRSAARHFGPRTIGVILSGSLDDGAAGLFAVKAAGGLTVVQKPQEAAVPSMPYNALRYTEADYVVTSEELASLLTKLMKTRVDKSKARRSRGNGENGSRRLLPFVCPDCDGPVSEHADGKLVQYQCAVGHKFSPESFSAAHTDALERALWIAVRTLENRKQIHKTLALRASESGDKRTHTVMMETGEAAERDLELIKEILQRLISGGKTASR
jgi:two-component system, chemotaxis family, protein-glutamate methylesterase/glutaminase